MNDKAWPTHKIIVPEYCWTIEFYDPTIGELEQMGLARNTLITPKSTAEQRLAAEGKIYDSVAGLIARWDCVNRAGEPVPKTGAGIKEQLPPVVMEMLTSGILDARGSKEEVADPKESGSSSLPTSQQGAAENEHAPPLSP